MLIKCVCSNCGHLYLSDDEAGDTACPRCDTVNEDTHSLADVPDAPMDVDPPFMDDAPSEFGMSDEFENLEDNEEEVLFEEAPQRFEAKAPPPMLIKRARLMRGIFLGALTAGAVGAVLAAAMAAIGVDVPLLPALGIGLVGGAVCRAGFGGRSAHQTKTRAVVACGIIVGLGFAGFFAGTWAVERLTGSRAKQTHADLDDGLQGLAAQYADAQDAGAAVVLKQRMDETRRLRTLSDPQIEDYIWIQRAQINHPLLAHAKLRLTASPIVKMGTAMDPIRVPKEATLGIRLAELIAAVVLATRAVLPRKP